MNPVVELRTQKMNETPCVEFGRIPDQEPDEQPVADELTEPFAVRTRKGQKAT